MSKHLDIVWKVRKCTRYKRRVHFSFRRNEKHPLSSELETASALQFHILFFLLRGFLLLLIAALLVQKLHFLISSGSIICHSARTVAYSIERDRRSWYRPGMKFLI